MIGHRLFAREPIGDLFYLHAATFEIPVVVLAEARMFQERSMSCYSCLVLYLHGFTEQRSMSASKYNNKCEMRYFAVCQAKKKHTK